jgi:hypothetical protein
MRVSSPFEPDGCDGAVGPSGMQTRSGHRSYALGGRRDLVVESDCQEPHHLDIGLRGVADAVGVPRVSLHVCARRCASRT